MSEDYYEYPWPAIEYLIAERRRESGLPVGGGDYLYAVNHIRTILNEGGHWTWRDKLGKSYRIKLKKEDGRSKPSPATPDLLRWANGGYVGGKRPVNPPFVFQSGQFKLADSNVERLQVVAEVTELQERFLRLLDKIGDMPAGTGDPRRLAIARTHIEDAVDSIKKALHSPTGVKRIQLPDEVQNANIVVKEKS